MNVFIFYLKMGKCFIALSTNKGAPQEMTLYASLDKIIEFHLAKYNFLFSGQFQLQ